MRIKQIAFTGADDVTDPRLLVDLSRQVPQVEWGILMSRKMEGERRFPTLGWLRRLVKVALATPSQPRLAAHLCGAALREVVAGDFLLYRERHDVLWVFNRVQLNFHGTKIGQVDGLRSVLSPGSGYTVWDGVRHAHPEFIFQMDGVNEDTFHALRGEGLPVSPLFDLSHGEGAAPEAWPPPVPGLYCGYAGGLGPHNLAEQLPRIADAAGGRDVWIDMETLVRNDDDVFDLDKVKRCLDIAEPFF